MAKVEEPYISYAEQYRQNQEAEIAAESEEQRTSIALSQTTSRIDSANEAKAAEGTQEIVSSHDKDLGLKEGHQGINRISGSEDFLSVGQSKYLSIETSNELNGVEQSKLPQPENKDLANNLEFKDSTTMEFNKIDSEQYHRQTRTDVLDD